MHSAVTLAVSLLAPSTLAWGTELHNAVGVVAQHFLNDNAKAQLKAILPQYNGNIRNATTWADEIKQAPYKPKYNWFVKLATNEYRASNYHFVNTADNPSQNCSYVDERDCPDNKCVVGAIANYTSQALCDKATGKALFPGQAQEEAVKFLTHFIGDIAQPLHVCGRALGGNNITAILFDGNTVINNFTTNLHALWDFTIPQKLLPLKYKGSQDLFAAELIDKIEKGEYKDIAQSWISKRAVTDLTKLGNSAAAAEWATDANGWNCDIVWGAYDSDPKQDFGKAYYEAAIPVIKIQVAKGGYRLAKWLNAVFDTCQPMPLYTTSSTQSSACTTPSPYSTTEAPAAGTHGIYSSASSYVFSRLALAVAAALTL
ncbi:hypothetical protein HDV03_001435 [Kappamyces sp. JEL0829]|nr:hypothetical protein HDV03_001435 [Kappamyces sp. JEL0829]